MQDQVSGWDAEYTCKYFGGTKPIDKSTLYRGVNDGRFPRPYKLGPGTSRWDPEECREARRKLMAARYSDDAAQAEEGEAENDEATEDEARRREEGEDAEAETPAAA